MAACGDALGTDRGYQRHQRAGETPVRCPPCVAAHARKNQAHQSGRRRRGQQDDGSYLRACRAALAYLWRTDPPTAERIEAEAGYTPKRAVVGRTPTPRRPTA